MRTRTAVVSGLIGVVVSGVTVFAIAVERVGASMNGLKPSSDTPPDLGRIGGLTTARFRGLRGRDSPADR